MYKHQFINILIFLYINRFLFDILFLFFKLNFRFNCINKKQSQKLKNQEKKIMEYL